jgi:hypothetical protein
MSKKIIGFAIIGVLTAGVAAVLFVTPAEMVRLRTEVARLRGPAGELAALRAENARRRAPTPNREEAVVRAQDEIERLRGEAERLRLQLQATEQARTDRAARKAAAEKLGKPKPPAVIAPGLTAPDALQNLGRTAPSLAFQTMAWAQQQGNLQSVADCMMFAEADRAKMQTIFAGLSAEERARLGTPERLAAAVILLSNQGTMPPMQVVAETPQADGGVVVSSRGQLPSGEVKTGIQFTLRRYPDGWKVEAPAAQVEFVRRTLAALPPAQRRLLGTAP